jgi:hypothetical protein
MSSNSNKYSDAELETFANFDVFVRRDGYRLDSHVVPTGYAEYAVDHQFDANPPAFPAGAPLRTFFFEGRNTVVVTPASQLPRPLGRGAPRPFDIRNGGFSPTFQKGRTNPKAKFDFERATANARSDLGKSQAKFGEPHGYKDCHTGHSPKIAKREESFHSLKARNAELLEMLLHMQGASEELRVRSLTIPGQEARFGNWSLDNHSISEDDADAGPSEKKTSTHATSAEAAASKPARSTRSRKNGAVPETPEDVKMGQYATNLVNLLKKIKLAHPLDGNGETTG